MSDDTNFMSDIVAGAWRLGSWKKSTAELGAWIGSAVDLGLTTFDLADVYGRYTTEAEFGAALRADPGLVRRMQIVTKCNIRIVAPARPENVAHVYDSSAEYIVGAVERSLADLRVERIDLLLLHRQDPLLDPDDVAEAFTRLEAAGKVRAFGMSNATPSHFAMVAARIPQPLVTNQVQASLLRLDPFLDGTFDQAIELGRPPMAWSPLGGGELFRDPPARERTAEIRAVLDRIARELGEPPEAVALAFLTRHPARIRPVVGSGRAERLARLSRAREIRLERPAWFDLWRAATGAPLP